LILDGLSQPGLVPGFFIFIHRAEAQEFRSARDGRGPTRDVAPDQ
jgi:hypothetical protein